MLRHTENAKENRSDQDGVIAISMAMIIVVVVVVVIGVMMMWSTGSAAIPGGRL